VKVRFTPFALAELDALFYYIEERNPPAALRVKRRIMELTYRLGDMPKIGVQTDLKDVRMLIAHPYPYLALLSRIRGQR
jgi:plasmid stabilization system protein ParE